MTLTAEDRARAQIRSTLGLLSPLYLHGIPFPVVLHVAHALYASEYASVLEAAGFNFPPQSKLEEWVPCRTPFEYACLLGPLLGRLEQATGINLPSLFAAMGMPVHEARHYDRLECALFDLLMGCAGHGVTIHDDFSGEWGQACVTFGLDPCDSPFSAELTAFRELAEERARCEYNAVIPEEE